MLISSYNPSQMGDVLVTIINPDKSTQASEQKQDVTRIYEPKTDLTLGYNFFKLGEYLPDLKGKGQVFLTTAQVATLNDHLEAVGFKAELEADLSPKFVVGKVLEMTEHPDSDHLHITKVKVDNEQVLQIVCGAPNVDVNQHVVVAKVGAMMPSGALIWPGKLRGVKSDGMLCAARELALPNAPQKRGILVLGADEFPVGQAFDFEKGRQLFIN